MASDLEAAALQEAVRRLQRKAEADREVIGEAWAKPYNRGYSAGWGAAVTYLRAEAGEFGPPDDRPQSEQLCEMLGELRETLRESLGPQRCRYYVASAYQNRHQARDFMRELERRGHEITMDWTRVDAATSFELAEEIGRAEQRAVAQADRLILLLPGGPGAHTEFGIAYGMGKPCTVVGTEDQMVRPDGRPVAFYFLPGVQRVRSTDAVLASVPEVQS